MYFHLEYSSPYCSPGHELIWWDERKKCVTQSLISTFSMSSNVNAKAIEFGARSLQVVLSEHKVSEQLMEGI